MTLSQTSVLKLYSTVIDDVISGVREAFLDEGIDEQVLQELRQIWVTKLMSSKAVEVQPAAPEPQAAINNIQKEPKPVMQQHATQNSQQQHHQVQQQQHHHHQQQQQQQQQQTQQQQQQQQQQQSTANFLQDYSNKLVPIQITLPPQQGSTDLHQRVLTIQVPASALQGNQLQSVLTGSVISATMALPQHLASTLLQQHVTAALQGQASLGAAAQPQVQASQQSISNNQVLNHNSQVTDNRQLFAHQTGPGALSQLDGANDSSDDEDEDDDDEEEEDVDDDDDVEDKDDEENEDNDNAAEEEPLNSGDDVSEEDPGDMFETDNVVVCQYDKITRSRNKWKFYLKDGIMNLGGKDFIFQKANGDAEW